MFHFRRDDPNQPTPSDDEYPSYRINEPERRPRWREAPVWREATREEEAEFERRREAVLRQMAEHWGSAALPPPLDAAEVERRKQTIMNFFAPRQEPPSPTTPAAWKDGGTPQSRGAAEPPSPALAGGEDGGMPTSAGRLPAPQETPADGEGGAISALTGQRPVLPPEGALQTAVPAAGEAGGELLAPVYLLVEEAPPPLERPLKRQPPSLGKIAPLPPTQGGSPAGEWVGRWASLTTADDPLYVLRVGLNALLELRLSQRLARSSPAALNLAVPPLERETLLSWPTERLLAWLDMESEQLVLALEAPLPRLPGWAREALDEFRRQVLGKREQRLAALVAVLRKRLQKRRTVRQIGELVTRLAWQHQAL